MLFLIESSVYSGRIISHGVKREDLSGQFREKALRALSGSCVKVYDAHTDIEIMFGSDYINERLDVLEQLMLSGSTSLFTFRFNGEPDTDIQLSIQEYSL